MRLLLLVAGMLSFAAPALWPASSFADERLYASLSPLARRAAKETVQHTLERVPSGQERSWSSLTGAESGRVLPVRTFKTSRGVYCREFEEHIASAAGTSRARRIACRNDDGYWVMRQTEIDS